MAKIRELALTDIFKINKLMSYMDVQIKSFFDEIILPCPFNALYSSLPLRIKYLPESYVLMDKKNIKAYISAKRTSGNYKKWKISKLYMGDNSYEAGLLLLQYLITKFGAKGANTFVASIEETQNELIQLFVDGAGFRQCSRQQIWKCKNLQNEKYYMNGLFLRPFKNSDAKAVAQLYNENLLIPFKPSLSKNKMEYEESYFAGLYNASCFKYVLEDRQSKQIISYFSLKTTDNKNYLLDVLISKSYETLFEKIIWCAYNKALKRTKNATLFVINKHYLQTANSFEDLLKEKDFEQSNSSVLLVKDLFKTITAENELHHALFYREMNSTPAFKSQLL